MARGTMKRYLSMCLVIVMLLTTLLPVGAYAADDSAIEDTATNYEEPVASELEDVSVELEDQESEQVDDTSAVTEISDYATFLSCFKVLEGYAQTYTEENVGENANALIINYIRTGVERYTSGTWEMVCGKENTAFTAYVSEQDTANNTSASALKNINNFTLPNGNKVDLGHVFGAMDVANYAKVQGMTDAVVQARADMGSWAGDITDLMYCAENVDIADKVDTTETDVDTLAANIRARYLGVDYGTLNSVDHSFTDTDLYGDMDAFYLTTEMNRGGVALSTIIENYFTAGLTDASRASYFLTNRLGGMVTKDGIRSKVMSTYTGNTLIGALESSYSLTDLSNYETLRKACCYAFADYLFDLAGDPNGTDPVDPDPDPEPDPEPDDAYYSVFSSDTTTVAPGVTQTINYALTKDDKQMLTNLQTIRNRRMLWSPDIVALNKRISDLTSQNQTLAFLKQQGLVDPDIFIAKTNELTKQLRQVKLEKEKLMDAESDMTALQTRDLIDLLEGGPEFLDSFDTELFGELVEKIIIEGNDSVRFCLKNGLELQESIERTVR